jgi:hypothetical protein
MVSYSNYSCWEIMNCKNLYCLARREPGTPCWEIAKRVEAYHNVSNTCRDCVVFILNEKTAELSMKQKGLLKYIEAEHQVCIS